MKQSEFSTGIKSMTKIMSPACLLLKNGNQGSLIVLKSHLSSWHILAKNVNRIILIVPFAVVFTGGKARHNSRTGPVIWIA